MNLLILLAFSGLILLTAYFTYGRFIEKKMKIDPERETPAKTLYDGRDYSPAATPVLLGHHFATIAGGGPIVGPVTAAIFGWLPALIWILLGSIFIGGVHDYTSLQASIRHKAKSIGAIIKEYIGGRGQVLFLSFTISTLILIVGVFVILVANTFEAVPQAATASSLFLLIAIGFGVAINQLRVPLSIASAFGILAMAGSIWAGLSFPLVLSASTWSLLLLGYCYFASVLPVWFLLQPRDYLNSFLLYGIILGAMIGIVIAAPTLQLPAYTGFYQPQLGYLFPILFITVACGAISGFHSLVSSGTTAKQLSNERSGRLVAYGSMLLEAFLAVIAIGTVAYLSQAQFSQRLAEMGGPIGAFAAGVGFFMSHWGIPLAAGITLTGLAASAFLLTSLDSATRLARYALQELSEERMGLLKNPHASTLLALSGAGALALTGSWQTIWPLFGAANQMLGALALLAVTVWLAKTGVKPYFTILPMCFMFVVTLSALSVLMHHNFQAQNYLLVGASFVLLILCVFLALEGWNSVFSKGVKHIAAEA